MAFLDFLKMGIEKRYKIKVKMEIIVFNIEIKEILSGTKKE